MPKIASSALPVSGLFGVAKPSGPTSMAIINDLKQLIGSSRLFVEESKIPKDKAKQRNKGKRGKEAVKIGQGGTLDPLADGVLVLGIGKGTKKLGEFLDCVKEYRTTCLLGCETDSYDSEGAQVRLAPWKHVTRESVENALDQFRGDIEQKPPIFSALKMDGKPLYEYARKGIPLPRPIEKRPVTVHELELVDWLGSEHTFSYPEKKFTEEEKQALAKSLQSVEGAVDVRDEVDADPVPQRPAAFVLRMRVSGGTYVRSIAHDLGHALGSAAHVVTLTRTRQGRFALEPKPEEPGDFGCVPWEVFERALVDAGEADADGWTEWEREVMERLDVVDGEKGSSS
ncbi:pseudouridine synthase [Gloeophyllum trabeum ATCC 11539]|uniref:tRNA pseudouridine(55) synthase n=1 Tax=Gloeophyllum trabeum (strain ATCC 11539 / FP-39264 / Madison 617) TaxID=670483 RepID=S7RUC4_GLOTA|nr:pseudouridine synthase [Gloeophyllum trabeum ATCC 11539]EPQ58330.1 pseudouridine synthase [Gloeophyllum trabeum ATCC 11539]